MRWAIRVVVSLALVLALAAPAAGAGERLLISSSRLLQRPFRGLVLVSIDNVIGCTGFVVAPRKVVTAGHCLTRDAAHGDYRFRSDVPGSIRLYRGYSAAAGGSHFPSCRVKRAWAHWKFIRSDATDTSFGSEAHDYAVLTTERRCAYPWDAVLRLWPTTRPGAQLHVGDGVKLGGYPHDPRFSGMTGLNLWQTRGSLRLGDRPDVLSATAFVAQGMSGGPVWRGFGRDSPCGRAQCVIGIITECVVDRRGHCSIDESGLQAVRVTPGVRKAVRRH